MQERAAIRCFQGSDDVHTHIVPHKTLRKPDKSPVKSDQQNQCWSAKEPPDGSNAFMNNAAFCAVHLRFPMLIIEQPSL